MGLPLMGLPLMGLPLMGLPLMGLPLMGLPSIGFSVATGCASVIEIIAKAKATAMKAARGTVLVSKIIVTFSCFFFGFAFTVKRAINPY